MKLTEVQRCIIAVNIIGVILEEYNPTDAIKALKTKCEKFRDKQSGVELRRGIPVISDAKRYKQYTEMNVIGDRIWEETIDHFAKQKLKIDAISLIESIFLFNENILLKHTTIKRDDLDRYRFEFPNNDSKVVLNGTAVGGHIMDLLAKEMGETVNGKLRALKLKIKDRL